MNKHHPDRDILREFAKKRSDKIRWTRKETDAFIKAVNRYGKDYKMISNAVQTKTAEQIRYKVSYMHKQIASNPKHENAKHAKVLKKISLREKHFYTDKQNTLVKALQKHGKDYNKIGKYFPTESVEKIRIRVHDLKRLIQSNKNHQHANLKETLEKTHS